MKNLDKECFICGHREYTLNQFYKRCLYCGHEIILTNEEQTFIINDKLDKGLLKKDMLYLFKEHVVLKSAKENFLLVDIGSGSGQFLYHIRNRFNKVLGIEVTDECLKFSRDVLNLQVFSDIKFLDEKYSIATFWHSLEHIPAKEIVKIISKLSELANENSRIIISVPNCQSIQFALFETRNAYFDYPNHLHQFSYNSLELLMKKYDFEVEKDFFSFYYILFGYVQGFLNKMNKIHNYFYYRRKRGVDYNLPNNKKIILDLYNYFMILIFLIPSLLLTILEFFTKNKRTVITLCFRKKKP